MKRKQLLKKLRKNNYSKNLKNWISNNNLNLKKNKNNKKNYLHINR